MMILLSVPSQHRFLETPNGKKGIRMGVQVSDFELYDYGVRAMAYKDYIIE
jgi:hypothetical protein